MKHNISQLTAAQKQQIQLLNQDVLKANCEPADITLAMNFSYQIFKTRDALRHYFSQAWQGLQEDGVFIIDAFGGYESYRTTREKTEHDDFNYYWHQEKFNPITGDILCHIDFRFSDKSWLEKAFTYDWRMWTLPELQELLLEAGFKKVQVYWEGTDEESGEGNGEYYPTRQGEDDPAWIVYIVAEK